jgi:hypothetical protein
MQFDLIENDLNFDELAYYENVAVIPGTAVI